MPNAENQGQSLLGHGIAVAVQRQIQENSARNVENQSQHQDALLAAGSHRLERPPRNSALSAGSRSYKTHLPLDFEETGENKLRSLFHKKVDNRRSWFTIRRDYYEEELLQ